MINNDALEFAPILAPRVSTRGKPPSDLVMAMAWQLCAQIPPRAVVLVDIVNETLANKISKAMQYSGRFSARPMCTWEQVDNMSMCVNETLTTQSGKEYIWRFHAGEWGWFDPDTLHKVNNTLIPVNRTVACYLPSPPPIYTWLRVRHSWIAVSADVEGPPPNAMMLYKQSIKDEVTHSLESRRRASEVMATQMRVSDDLRGNATACIEMLQSPSPDLQMLAHLVAPHPRLAHCLLGLGWNAVFRRFDAGPDPVAATRAIQDLVSSAVPDPDDSVDSSKRKQGDKNEISKIIVDMWSNLGAEVKADFEAAAAELADKYHILVCMYVCIYIYIYIYIYILSPAMTIQKCMTLLVCQARHKILKLQPLNWRTSVVFWCVLCVYVYVCMSPFVHVSVYVCVYVCKRMHLCMYACVCTYIFTHLISGIKLQFFLILLNKKGVRQ